MSPSYIATSNHPSVNVNVLDSPGASVTRSKATKRFQYLQSQRPREPPSVFGEVRTGFGVISQIGSPYVNVRVHRAKVA